MIEDIRASRAGRLRQALELGWARGWITFRGVNSTTEGLTNTLLLNAVPLGVLILNRDTTWSGLPVAVGTAMLPGFLALMIVFSIMGTAYNLANEREDGTLLRAKTVPGGMGAYVVGLTVVACLDAFAGVLVVLVPGMFIVPGVPVGDLLLWLGVIGYTMLGLLACVPIGVLVGSVVRSPRVIGGLGFLFTMGLSAISGIYFPIQALWGWIQAVAQAFPMYWLGLGLRSVFLPAEAAAVELGGSWRVAETLAVLGVWAAIGLVAAPVVLRRMARRESGSAVEARRRQVLQRS
jgi:ABC-2 type transport system permease protein